MPKCGICGSSLRPWGAAAALEVNRDCPVVGDYPDPTSLLKLVPLEYKSTAEILIVNPKLQSETGKTPSVFEHRRRGNEHRNRTHTIEILGAAGC